MLKIDSEGRKNLALLAMLGGSVILTVYICYSLFLLQLNLPYVFYLAIAAHVQLFSLLAGLVAQLVKRRVSISKDGATINDEGTTQ